MGSKKLEPSPKSVQLLIFESIGMSLLNNKKNREPRMEPSGALTFNQH